MDSPGGYQRVPGSVSSTVVDYKTWAHEVFAVPRPTLLDRLDLAHYWLIDLLFHHVCRGNHRQFLYSSSTRRAAARV